MLAKGVASRFHSRGESRAERLDKPDCQRLLSALQSRERLLFFRQLLPALSKNQFNVLKLADMPRAIKDLAAARIQDTGAARMPPPRAGTLTPESIQAAIVELQR